MFSLVIFDVDGTLIDTERTGVLSLIRTVKELIGTDMAYEDAYSYYGFPSHTVGGMLGYSGKEDFTDRWQRNFIELSDLIVPFPGVEELLEKVKDQGYLTGIVTSRSRFEFEYDQILARMLKHIDLAVCAEDTEKHKPHPDPLLKCIELVSARTGRDLNPSECIYFGDTEHDFSCAEAAGCDFVLMDWKGRGWQSIPARNKVGDAKEMFEILGCPDC